MENEIENKLDALLKYLEGIKLKGDPFQDYEINECRKALKIDTEEDFYELLLILTDDKYVYSEIDYTPMSEGLANSLKVARLTMKGRFFISSGGYVGELEERALVLRKQILNEKIAKRNERLLVAGTLFAGLYGFLEVIKFVYSYFHSQYAP